MALCPETPRVATGVAGVDLKDCRSVRRPWLRHRLRGANYLLPLSSATQVWPAEHQPGCHPELRQMGALARLL